MLPHTGLFLLWKVALQMRIRRRLKSLKSVSDDLYQKQPYRYNLKPLSNIRACPLTGSVNSIRFAKSFNGFP